MADNVGYTPGSGATVAADDIGGVLFQRVKLTSGADGTANDVSTVNPLPVDVTGEVLEAIEALRMAVQALTRTIGMTQPDTAARMRVVVDNITGNLTLSTVTNVGTLSTLTTCSTLTNQTQIGSNPANDQIPALMRLAADSFRRNITVT